MAKDSRIGEMRTQITIKKLQSVGEDRDGFPVKEWANIFNGQKARCLWVNGSGMTGSAGTEAYEAMQLGLKEAATLTMRYTPLIDVQCRIWRENDEQTDANAYEIITIDNVRQENKRLEIKLKRLVKA